MYQINSINENLLFAEKITANNVKIILLYNYYYVNNCVVSKKMQNKIKKTTPERLYSTYSNEVSKELKKFFKSRLNSLKRQVIKERLTPNEALIQWNQILTDYNNFLHIINFKVNNKIKKE